MPGVDDEIVGVDIQPIDPIEATNVAGTPVVNRPDYAVIDEQAFRRCLIARGWTRRKVPVLDVPAGYYRGYEERARSSQSASMRSQSSRHHLRKLGRQGRLSPPAELLIAACETYRGHHDYPRSEVDHPHGLGE